MLQLAEHEFDCLARIVRNGAVALGDDCRLSTAIRLSLAGLVTITAEEPQHVIPTRRGEAFQFRGAA